MGKMIGLNVSEKLRNAVDEKAKELKISKSEMLRLGCYRMINMSTEELMEFLLKGKQIEWEMSWPK